MTIGVPIVTCLHRVRRIHKALVVNLHHCCNVIMFVVQGIWNMVYHQVEELYQNSDIEVLQQISLKRKVLAG